MNAIKRSLAWSTQNPWWERTCRVPTSCNGFSPNRTGMSEGCRRSDSRGSRENPATAPNAQGALVIDETGDRKDGHHTAHVARQYLGNVGKIENGVVSVSSLWADEQIDSPLEVEPSTRGVLFSSREDGCGVSDQAQDCLTACPAGERASLAVRCADALLPSTILVVCIHRAVCRRAAVQCSLRPTVGEIHRARSHRSPGQRVPIPTDISNRSGPERHRRIVGRVALP